MMRMKSLCVVAILLTFANIQYIDGGERPGNELIREDYLMGRIGYKDYLKFMLFFGLDRERLEKRYQHGDIPPCITGAIINYRMNRELFSPEERAEIGSLIEPEYRLGDGEERHREGERAKNICSHQYQNYITSQNFLIEWPDNLGISTDDAIEVGEALEDAWDAEIDDMGYQEPDAGNDYLIPVRLEEISWAGAYTSFDFMCGKWMPYITMSHETLSYPSYVKDVTAHEFFHVIQFGYFLETGVMSNSGWWWEATASWMEDEVWDSLNYYVYYLPYYTDYPHLALDTENYAHEYAMCIFAKYLSEYHGGPDIIKDTWEARGNNGDLIKVVGDLLENSDNPFDLVFSEFTAVNTVMDYDEGAYYPDVNFSNTHSIFPTGTIEVDDDRPRYYGTNYIKFRANELPYPGTIKVSFDGDEEKGGKDVNWNVVATVMEEEGGYRTFHLDMDEETQSGTIEIPDFGSLYSRVHLAVSPDAESTSGIKYSYSAEVFEADGGNDEDGTGCPGCRVLNGVEPEHITGVLILLPLLIPLFPFHRVSGRGRGVNKTVR